MTASEPPLVARVLGVQTHACPSGRHHDHPGMDCEGADEQIATERAVTDYLIRAFTRTPMVDVPAALRGPRWAEAATQQEGRPE